VRTKDVSANGDAAASCFRLATKEIVMKPQYFKDSATRINCPALAIAMLSLVACGNGSEDESTVEDGVVKALQRIEIDTPIYLNPNYSPEERAADLVTRMTLDEKVSQLKSSMAPAIPRLGVAQYGWWNEALHGVAREQQKDDDNPLILTNLTSYPSPLSVASTWDPELQYREAVEISDETREVFRDNKYNLNIYSPNVNLARDPRWGRNDETFGEDPYLTTVMASQFVNGMEGKDENGKLLAAGKGYLKLSTTIKHYAANNDERTRLTSGPTLDERTLREYYTRQFRDIVKASNPSSIMTAYNRVNDIPMSANVYLLDTLARETFGFKGFYTTDCDSIFTMYTENKQNWQPKELGRTITAVEAHAYAITAGVDLNCNKGWSNAFNYGNQLPIAISNHLVTPTGIVSEHDVDVAATRLFATRIRLGEFDDDANVPWVTKARSRLSRGTWVSAESNGAVTITKERLALARTIADESIVLLKNDPVKKKDGSVSKLLPLKVPASGTYRVAVVGYYASNYYYTMDQGDQFANPNLRVYLGGYSSDPYPSAIAKTVNGFNGIKTAVQAINPGAVVDYVNGFTSVRPDNGGQYSAAIMEIDEAAVQATGNYDAVIVYIGDDKSNAAEEADRVAVNAPGAQETLVTQVAARNPNTVVYMESIGQFDLAAFKNQVPALLWSSYNGQRKGEGLADVLFGQKSPSGHLPFTWYKDITQLAPTGDYSIRPNETSKGRTYQYFNGDIEYPFGYGLSYSDTKISRFEVEQRHVDANDEIEVSASITNTGRVATADVVQLYVTTPNAAPSLERPKKRLAGFKKVFLKPYETKRVNFEIDVKSLAFYNAESARMVIDNGYYGIQIGKSATEIEATSYVKVTGNLKIEPSVVTIKPIVVGDDASGIIQRVKFPKHAVIDPRPTVTLNDDTIFGYVTKGESRKLPRDLRIRYTSNRPEVVSVSRGGVIRTGRVSGVATVTVVADYNGSSTKNSFVVSVSDSSSGK
jgi:beta-glucosidase